MARRPGRLAGPLRGRVADVGRDTRYAVRRVNLRRLAALALAAPTLLVGACASPSGPPEVDVPRGEYSRAFAAAREIIREHRFHVDRVDAESGVITSGPKESSGLFTPWDTEQSSLAQEFDDTLNYQDRRVRVAFEARDPAAPTGGGHAPPADLRRADVPLVCRFEVTVERSERPGHRVPTRAVRQGSQTLDPEVQARGMWPTYVVSVRQDEEFAARLAGELRGVLARPREPGPDAGAGADPR